MLCAKIFPSGLGAAEQIARSLAPDAIICGELLGDSPLIEDVREARQLVHHDLRSSFGHYRAHALGVEDIGHCWSDTSGL
jgi:hypothetical protein